MTRPRRRSARGLTVSLLAVAAVACNRPASGPPAAPSPGRGGAPGSAGAAAPPSAAAVAKARAPFVHALLSQAATRPSHEDCSKSALLRIAERIRMTQQRRATAACATPETAELGQEVRGPLADRVRACVGQDGAFDAEWDTANSALLSLGACFDCRRPPRERTADCKRSREALDRAEKDARARKDPTAPPP